MQLSQCNLVTGRVSAMKYFLSLKLQKTFKKFLSENHGFKVFIALRGLAREPLTRGRENEESLFHQTDS